MGFSPNMPKYSLLVDTDTDSDLEAGVQKVTADYNLIRADADPELTAEQYLQRVMDIAVASYSKGALKEQTNIIAIKFEKADAAKRTEVIDALAGISVDVSNP